MLASDWNDSKYVVFPREKEQDRDTGRYFMAMQSYCVIKTATWYGEINFLSC